jgi:preprotein translocase subunit SecB
MKRSFLAIEGYYVKELSFGVTPKCEERAEYMSWSGFHFQPEPTYEPDPVTFDVYGSVSQNKDEPNRWYNEIQIKSHTDEKKNFPYSFDITIVGYFRLDGQHTQEHVNVFLYAHAPAILYAAAREVLATVTGRGPYPAIVLPSVSFIDDVEHMAVAMAKRIKQIGEKRLQAKKATKKGARKKGTKKAAK